MRFLADESVSRFDIASESPSALTLSIIVMAGLVPAIHAWLCCREDMDARHKAA